MYALATQREHLKIALCLKWEKMWNFPSRSTVPRKHRGCKRRPPVLPRIDVGFLENTKYL